MLFQTELSIRMDVETSVNVSVHYVVVLAQQLVNATNDTVEVTAVQVENVFVANFAGFPEDFACPNGTLRYHRRNETAEIDDAHSYFLRTADLYFNLRNIGFEMRVFPQEMVNGTDATPVIVRVAVCAPVCLCTLPCLYT